VTDLIDTHCHLDYLEQAPLAQLLVDCQQLGVAKILTVGVGPDNLEQVLNISNLYPSVFGSLGVHPHHAVEYNDDVEAMIIAGCKSDKIIAIGECGLDYHYNHSPPQIQRKVFEQQLDLAIKVDLPVIIHTREADRDTIDIMKNFSQLLAKKGVFHCYSAGQELANFALDSGFYLGFTGIITFAKADNVRQIVSMTPLDQILIETDAPFLAPKPFRGRKNSPLYLPYIATELAKIINQDEEIVRQQLWKNGHSLFDL
jgi:TatD DNase family protein